MANAEVFDSYFRRADLDKDGRISGQEAVAFFQGAALPQMTLAKIWQFADQGRTGFLSRVEFYNALKLVTVAQTGRDITPELVRAALTGPAAAQIPPPRINSPVPPPTSFGQATQPAGTQGGPNRPAVSGTNSVGTPSQSPVTAGAQGAYNGHTAQSLTSQGSNGGASERKITTQTGSLSSSQGDYVGGPTKKFSPHTNSAPMPQVGYGGPAKQLSPQASSLSNSQGGGGGPQLTTQTSNLSRYPPSLGQVQVAPTGFAQQNMTEPSAPGSQQSRPSLGSLFTTNSAWPPKGSTSPAASQFSSSSTSVPSVPPSLTTPTTVQSRPLTPASTGSMPNNLNTSSGMSSWGQATASAKNGSAGAAFDSGIDLFGGGFKATPTSNSASMTDSFSGDKFVVSQPESPSSITPPQPKSTPVQLEESMFRAEPVKVSTLTPVMQAPATGMGKSSGVLSTPQGPSRPGPTDIGRVPGGRPQAGPVMAAAWPQMTQNDLQRYTRVFTQVDTDKDGKITGEQARELFLSWQLPRGILKQVWDLSDQDNDSMLSMREFCTALYFMERYREGRTLPSALPTGIHLDTAPGSLGTGSQSAPVWRHIPGVPQAPTPISGTAQPPTQVPSQGPPPLVMPERGLPNLVEGGPAAPVREPYKSKVPALEVEFVNQLSRDEQEMLKTKHKAAEEADKKVYELDKEILDYKEKIELYRAKLQEIILFKSRCDNRLNEVTERVASDKREMESLSKKYDQRFKAAGEISSRLQAEEAAFRDIQEKKMELYTAIAKLEKGGEGNELQGRADHLSLDLDELKRILNERGRALGVKPKSAIPIEVPFGFQGVTENAVEWDDDWDKFDDEGFTNVQDIMDEMHGDFPSTTKSTYSAPWGNGESLFDDGFDFSSEPAIQSDIFKTGEDDDSSSVIEKSHSGLRGSDDFTGNGADSPEHDISTSSSRHVDQTFNTNKPSQRYLSTLDSQDFGGDTINGSTTFSSPSHSFDQGRTSFNASDPFGDSGAAWAFHDEESDSGFRASWGLQGSNPPSTQTSVDMSNSRTQTRFGKERGSIDDSLDMGSLRVSSPRGALFDGSIRISSPGGFDKSIRESSPGAIGFGGSSSPGWTFDHNGNGHDDYKNAFGSPRPAFDSPRSNAFGSPKYGFGSPKNSFSSPRGSKMSLFGGSSGFDATPSLFGGSPGASKRDDPYSSGGFLPFDSSVPGSPAAVPRGSGASEDHNIMGRGGDKSMQRFDSFTSVQSDRGRRRGFGSDDDSDSWGFGSTGPFGAGAQTSKHSDVWSNF